MNIVYDEKHATIASLDHNNCKDCRLCTDCKDCIRCVGCTDCKGCVDCVECIGCKNCVGCKGLVNKNNKRYVSVEPKSEHGFKHKHVERWGSNL